MVEGLLCDSHDDSGYVAVGAVAASLPCEVPVWTKQALMATGKESL